MNRLEMPDLESDTLVTCTQPRSNTEGDFGCYEKKF